MSEETIFHEVDEALRSERARKAWRRYGVWVIGAAVLVVAGVAFNEAWTWWQSGSSAKSSDEFYAALEKADGGDAAGAVTALDTLAASGSGQYPLLAKFKQASLLYKQGKKDEAAQAYDTIAGTQGNAHLKDLALLLAAEAQVDKGDVNAVKTRLLGLMADGNPLKNSARETLGLAQFKAGDINGARDTFVSISQDAAASDDIRSRVQLYLGELVARGAKPVVAEQQASDAGAAAAAAVSAASAAATPGAAAGANASASPASDAAAQPSAATPASPAPASDATSAPAQTPAPGSAPAGK